jgi:arabinofuranosyltransferase
VASPITRRSNARATIFSYRALNAHRVALVLASATVVALIAHAYHYHPFFSDDGFISLRYAERLLNGRGLTWDDHERVEGYTNFLWTLLCAALGLAHRDLVADARFLGLSSACAVLLAIIFCYPPLRWRSVGPALAGAGIIAASGAIAVWAIGGLEQPLLAACIAWGLALFFSSESGGVPRYGGARARRRTVLTSLCFALACLTRPDALLVVCAVLAGYWAGHGFSRGALRRVASIALLPAVFVTLHLLIRRAYYGEWVPNSAFAKVAFTQHRLDEGLAYLTGAISPLKPLLAPIPFAILLAIFDRARRARLSSALFASLVWVSYVAVIGGDIFPARRHLVILLVLLAFISAEVLSALITLRRPRYAVANIAAFGLVLALATTQSRDPENERATVERWEWDAKPIGEMLKQAFAREQPLMAVDAAGSLPYFSELPSLDMLGINDRYLAHHPPPGFGQGYLGHELGDGAYVLSRKPDLIVFHVPTGDVHPAFRSGQEVEADPSFAKLYQLVAFESAAPERLTARIWVRKQDSRLGESRSDGFVHVPAYLVANENAPAQMSARGLRVIVGQNAPGKLSLALAAGHWQIALEDAPTRMTISSPNRHVLEDSSPNQFSFELDAETLACAFEFRPRDAMLATLASVTFRRTEAPH